MGINRSSVVAIVHSLLVISLIILLLAQRDKINSLEYLLLKGDPRYLMWPVEDPDDMEEVKNTIVSMLANFRPHRVIDIKCNLDITDVQSIMVCKDCTDKTVEACFGVEENLELEVERRREI